MIDCMIFETTPAPTVSAGCQCPSGIDPGQRGAVLKALHPGERTRLAFAGRTERLSANDEDLRTINELHSGETLKAGDIEIFERYSANDAVMRSPLKFTRRALEKFAQDFTQGRGVHLNHEDNKGFGRTFKADVVEATVRGVKANWLRVKLYVVTKGATPERLQLISDVKSGVLGYDSITFMAGQWEFREVPGEGDQAGLYFFEVDDNPNEHPRLEAAELSLLSTLGNVYGAGSDKGRSLSTSTIVDLTLSSRDAPAQVVPDDPYEVALKAAGYNVSGTTSGTPAAVDDPYTKALKASTESPKSVPDPVPPYTGGEYLKNNPPRPGTDPYEEALKAAGY